MSEPNLNVGDVWQDNDRRIPTRFLVIREIIGPKVLCDVFMLNYKSAKLTMYLCAAPTTISIRRLRPTSNGYRRRKDLDNASALHNYG